VGGSAHRGGQLRRGLAALDSVMSAMQGSPVEVDHTSRSGGARWTRGRDRRRLSFPGVRRRGGWRKRGGGELRVVISGVGSARIRTRGGYHQVRKEKGERSGRKGGAWPHLWCRFRAETPADVRSSDEQLRGLAASLRRGEERDGRGVCGVLIGRVLMANYLRGDGAGVTPASSVSSGKRGNGRRGRCRHAGPICQGKK
jgi:hypothetical protein